jgi:plastocyanin
MVRALHIAAALATVVAAGDARGEEATGTVRGTVTVSRSAGLEPEPVVVYIVGFTEPPPHRTALIKQRNKRFIPPLVAITAGQSVGFPNGDPFLHNVFSPTPLRRFDLGSFPEGESRERPFPGPGVVDVFCNIHPEMSATILVLPNRRFAVADRAGRFEIAGVPPGAWTIFAYSRRTRKPVEAPLVVKAGEVSQVDLALAESKVDKMHKNKFGETYRDPEKYR